MAGTLDNGGACWDSDTRASRFQMGSLHAASSIDATSSRVRRRIRQKEKGAMVIFFTSIVAVGPTGLGSRRADKAPALT
jgi:hypothetical protein